MKFNKPAEIEKWDMREAENWLSAEECSAVLSRAGGSGGNGQGVSLYQNSYTVDDSVTYTHGKHSLHIGGGINRSRSMNRISISLPGWHICHLVIS